MQDQPFLGGEVLVFGHLICFINKGELVNDLAGLFGVQICILITAFRTALSGALRNPLGNLVFENT